MATDPVCGMQVDERTAAGGSVFEGRTYFFCSASCEKKFRDNPAQFLVATAAPAGHEHHARAPPPSAAPKTAAAGGKVTYTCPMHPEIVRDAPGDCPLCGMALVPIAGTGAGEADDSELRDLARRLWIGVALFVPMALHLPATLIDVALGGRPAQWV